MAQTFGNLFESVCSLENLYAAAGLARRRKTRREDVERFELHRERYLRQLHDDLLAATWRPAGYRRFTLHDPRTRSICAAPYRDRVVHHALCNVIGPVLSRRFVHDSYSCQPGKGTLAARERCRAYTSRFRYVLKCDIRKYFESIDHDALLAKLASIIRCQPTLRLCRLIVDSHAEAGIPAPCFPGDDLFAWAARRRGLPIGNLTSQLWANLYLDRMDHVVKEELRVPGYARYTDDFLLWADDKAFLRHCRDRLAGELERERLLLHPAKTRLLPCAEGVPFLGSRFFPGRAPRLLGETKRRAERRARRQVRDCRRGDLDAESAHRSWRGWTAFASYGSVRGLISRYRKIGFGHPGA